MAVGSGQLMLGQPTAGGARGSAEGGSPRAMNRFLIGTIALHRFKLSKIAQTRPSERVCISPGSEDHWMHKVLWAFAGLMVVVLAVLGGLARSPE
jgi:hypothetical protein